MITRVSRGSTSYSVLLTAFALAFSPGLLAQQASSGRKLVERTAPAYPALARNMALQGLVKVDALVSPDGTVKSVEIKGGHPVLAQAAASTVRRWKWEPADRETHELVELRFSPE